MSKKIKILMLVTFVFVIINIIFVHYSNAAIQIKEGAQKDGAQRITVNEMFDNCYNMRNQASTLGNNNLDPHLCNAREWGAMYYLGMSSYGSTSLGLGVSLEGKDYQSLNGNMSGVMLVWGSPYNQTNAAINSTNNSNSNTASNSRLYDNNYKQYVDRITEATVEGTRGMALQEVSSWENGTDFFSAATNAPVLYRFENYSKYTRADRYTGGSEYNYCYRPVIWN